MMRTLMIIGLVLTLAIAVGCGAPGATVGNTPPPPPPPTQPLVVDLADGTWIVGGLSNQLTLRLAKSGNCPEVAPGTTFQATTCYQAENVDVVGGCNEVLGVVVGQDSNNNLQIAFTNNPLPGATKDYTFFGVGSITSATSSNGTFTLSCGGASVSGKWAAGLVQN
jgi:hypothetical protein